MAEIYADFLRRLLVARWGVLAAAAVLLVMALFLLGRTGSELYPMVDAGQFQIYVRLPSGTRIENTESAVKQIEQAVIEEIGQPDPWKEERYPDSNLRMLISNIGVLMDWPAAYTPNSGPMDAFVMVQLKNTPGMPGTFDYVSRLRSKLHQEFPLVEFSFDTGGDVDRRPQYG